MMPNTFDLEITPFIVREVPLMEVNEVVIAELSSGRGVMARLQDFERRGGCSLWDGNRYICSYGIVTSDEGIGTLWLLPSERLRDYHPVSLVREIRRRIYAMMEYEGVEELQARVWGPNEQGHRLVKLLGLEYESKTDNNYFVYTRYDTWDLTRLQ